MKTIRRISLWTVLSVVAAGLAIAADEPLVITNKDLPKTPTVSVLGTLKVAETRLDTGWIDRIDAMVSELETGRQQPSADGPARRRSSARDYCSVGVAPPITRVAVGQTCLYGECPEDEISDEVGLMVRPACPYGVCPDGRPPLEPRRFFGIKHKPKPRPTPSPHLVDALPTPPGGFAGRPGKHLGPVN